MSLALTCVLPIRMRQPADPELFEYVGWLASRTELIVVDGSDSAIFEEHARHMPSAATHCQPDYDLTACANGKVAGVITGLRRASHEAIVIADDDVRYDATALQRIAVAIEHVDLVRPQNYFAPLTWHACWDTARSLLNRLTGGDWPGTLAVRRSALPAFGYDGDVLFENLELVRTVVAAGGTAICPLDLFVQRRPPTTRHFWSQRVRQAYDETARPLRLLLWLTIVPVLVAMVLAGRWDLVVLAALASSLLAEAGRRRAGGRLVFSPLAALLAPLWLVERGVCAWLALAAHVFWGGIPYNGRLLTQAATPMRDLRARVGRA